MNAPICKHCGAEIQRKRYGKYFESMKQFMGRQFCSRDCIDKTKRAVPLLERFNRRVDPNGPMHPYDQSLGRCWMWNGSKVMVRGLPRAMIFHEGKPRIAARVAFELFKGPLGNLFACHSCDNTICVNPDHLFSGTAKDNSKDCQLKGRIRACRGDKNGLRIHPESILRGERHPNRKLCDSDVIAIRLSKEPTRVLATRFKVDISNIRFIQKGKAWSHLKLERTA